MNGSKITATALKHLGEDGRATCTAYGLPFGSHWCCAFVWRVFNEAGASKLFYGGQKTAYVPTAQAWLHANCKHVKMSQAKPGDIVVFTWSGGGYNGEHGSRDHIGIIRAKGTATVCYTVEGNTGGSAPTNSHVMKRTRPVQYIFAIYRPNYPKDNTAGEPAKKKDEVIVHKAKYEVVSKIGSNIRKGHNVNTKKIGAVPCGTIVKTTHKYKDWVKCRKGWICIKDKNGTYLKKK